MKTETVAENPLAPLAVGTALYHRAQNECLPEHRDLMVEVWSPTPWMLDVNVGSGDGRRHEIRNWCNRNLGRESSPIHGQEGDWHEGGVTIHGQTWYGFKTEAMLKHFKAQFPSPTTLTEPAANPFLDELTAPIYEALREAQNTHVVLRIRDKNIASCIGITDEQRAHLKLTVRTRLFEIANSGVKPRW